MYERLKRLVVFSEEECGFNFKEARKKENKYEYGMCKLQMMIERKKEENGGK